MTATGAVEGDVVGSKEVGNMVGKSVGKAVGPLVGVLVGSDVGTGDERVSTSVGFIDGISVAGGRVSGVVVCSKVGEDVTVGSVGKGDSPLVGVSVGTAV